MLVELGLVEQRYQAVLEVLNNASPDIRRYGARGAVAFGRRSRTDGRRAVQGGWLRVLGSSSTATRVGRRRCRSRSAAMC